MNFEPGHPPKSMLMVFGNRDLVTLIHQYIPIATLWSVALSSGGLYKALKSVMTHDWMMRDLEKFFAYLLPSMEFEVLCKALADSRAVISGSMLVQWVLGVKWKLMDSNESSDLDVFYFPQAIPDGFMGLSDHEKDRDEPDGIDAFIEYYHNTVMNKSPFEFVSLKHMNEYTYGPYAKIPAFITDQFLYFWNGYQDSDKKYNYYKKPEYADHNHYSQYYDFNQVFHVQEFHCDGLRVQVCQVHPNFMNINTAKEWVEKTFDFRMLQMVFTGDRIHIPFWWDIVNRHLVHTETKWNCNKPNRTKKYESRGFSEAKYCPCCKWYHNLRYNKLRVAGLVTDKWVCETSVADSASPQKRREKQNYPIYLHDVPHKRKDPPQNPITLRKTNPSKRKRDSDER